MNISCNYGQGSSWLPRAQFPVLLSSQPNREGFPNRIRSVPQDDIDDIASGSVLAMVLSQLPHVPCSLFIQFARRVQGYLYDQFSEATRVYRIRGNISQ